MDLGQRVRSVMAIDPGAVAIEFEGVPVDWAMMTRLVDGIEGTLLESGVAAGESVGLLLRNRPEMVAAMLAAILNERCIVTINPQQGEAKLTEEIGSLRVSAIIGTVEDWTSSAVREAADLAGSVAIVLDRKAELPVRRVTTLEQPGPGPHHRASSGVAVEMLTSGTTGPPKRIELRAEALAKSLLSAEHYELNRPAEPTLRKTFAILSSPVVHVGGIFHCLKAAVDGRPICLLERFSVAAWREAIRRHRPKVASLVPSAMKMVMDANVPKADLTSLRAVTSGTAPLTPELQAAFEERYGIPVLAMYGATEFAGGVAGWSIRDHRDFGREKRGSVGRAHPGCELRVVDPESGGPVGTDEQGLLQVKGEQLPQSGWVGTSDLARIDSDGFLWILGRADGVINRGGFKVDPAAVARALECHDAIREAAVVGLPDERLGEVPVAVYELRGDVEAPSEEELSDFAKAHLTRYFVPTRFLAVDAIPRTPSLKPSAPAVRALFLDD